MLSVGIVLGLSATLTFGLSDFFSALVSRQIGSLYALLGVQVVGIVVLLLYVLKLGQTIDIQAEPLLITFLIGAGLGILDTVAYLSFYKGLSLGPITIVSPIASSSGIVTVLLAVIVFSELLSFWQEVGICFTLGGVFLAAVNSSIIPGRLDRHSFFSTARRSLVLRKWRTLRQFKSGVFFGCAAMVGFGLFLFFLARWTEVVGSIVSVLLIRIFSAITLALYAFCQRASSWRRISMKSWGGIFIIGLFDTVGLVAYSSGTTRDLTSVVAAISSSYSIIPIFLGIVVFRERLARLQGVGVSAIIAGLFILTVNNR